MGTIIHGTWKIYNTGCRCDLCRIAASAYKDNYSQDKRDYITWLKEHGECMDCGETDSIVLEFDHRPGTKKKASISQMVWNSWKMLNAELEKCDIVCANCHTRRTKQRGQHKQGVLNAAIPYTTGLSPLIEGDKE